MSHPALRIALAQINPTVGDIEGNAARIIAMSQRAHDQERVDLVVFPELALTGYPPEDLVLRNDMYPRLRDSLAAIQQAATTNVLLGTPWREEAGRCYNSATFLPVQGDWQHYYKAALPNYGVFDEKRYFSVGVESMVIEINRVKIGVVVCEDIWTPDSIVAAKAAGAVCMVAINASPFDLHNRQQRVIQACARIQESGLPLVYVNQVGGQDELVFDGYSMVLDHRAKHTLQMPDFQEAMAVVAIDTHGAVSRVSGDQINARRQDVAVIYDALVCGVRDYIGKNGFTGAVIGLSGGIDSALTLAIACDAVGTDNVQAVMMPFEYTADMSKQDAAAQAQALGVEYREIPIQLPYQAFNTLLADEFASFDQDTTEENIQARCRGLLLMAIANKKRRIVLATGNKSEMAVGYATLYGDMVGGFAPLKDVPKTLVYQLATYYNHKVGCGIIPRRVIERPPSAELAPDQVDTDTLPPYEQLDAILYRFVEQDQSLDDIVKAGFDRQEVQGVINKVVRNEYKRRQAAPGVRITARAFGRDRRYPITSRFFERVSF